MVGRPLTVFLAILLLWIQAVVAGFVTLSGVLAAIGSRTPASITIPIIAVCVAITTVLAYCAVELARPGRLTAWIIAIATEVALVVAAVFIPGPAVPDLVPTAVVCGLTVAALVGSAGRTWARTPRTS
ncbi:hypothetical protein [Stackebrandtia soli]|uniref:hypothetical protein n=1 Tax=Stackebrandtia soli TaxID=1892856 RepID=UPI0039EC7B4F